MYRMPARAIITICTSQWMTTMPQSRDMFVDTSGWVSYINQGDSQHAEAVLLCQTAVTTGRRLVTTDHHFTQAGFLRLLTR